MYGRVRRAKDPPEATAERFRRERDVIFGTSRQTPLNAEQLAAFRGLDYFAYHADWRTIGTISRSDTRDIELPAGDDGMVRARRFGDVTFELFGGTHSLPVYWITGYGGGVFLPFRDSTSGNSTYGGGRYLYDTIKGADLGGSSGELVMDFNYAYNPSCAYDSRWICPLPRSESRLDLAIEAGEKAYSLGR